MTSTGRLLAAAIAVAAGLLVWQVVLPAMHRGSDATAQGASAVLGTIDRAQFVVADANLSLQLRNTGSYVGAAMPPGALLVRADAVSYCVQAGAGTGVVHEQGPGGAPTSGAC